MAYRFDRNPYIKTYCPQNEHECASHTCSKELTIQLYMDPVLLANIPNNRGITPTKMVISEARRVICRQLGHTNQIHTCPHRPCKFRNVCQIVKKARASDKGKKGLCANRGKEAKIALGLGVQ